MPLSSTRAVCVEFISSWLTTTCFGDAQRDEAILAEREANQILHAQLLSVETAANEQISTYKISTEQMAINIEQEKARHMEEMQKMLAEFKADL